uniref:Uncharacterized protein n=1 Tax=Oryza nivara TaxID=4536 RepID=A0A0E0GQU1_ORYNI
MASLPKPPPPPRPKTRGSYNCGRCGLPKKGHVCAAGGPAPTPSPSSSSGAATTTTSGGGGGGGEGTKLRRALSFEDAATASASATPSSPEKKPRVVPDADAVGRGGEGEVEMVEGQGGEEELEEEEAAVELGGRAVPRELMAEVLRRLGPRGVMAAAAVSRGWRDCAGRVWRAAEELRLRAAGVSLVGALLPRCPALSRLSLRMESDVDATILACLAFSCPSLGTLEISMSDNAVNRMTGYVETLSLISCCIRDVVINCPNMSEISLCFTQQSNDCTDLVTLMDGLGRTCPNLKNMHISSAQLSNEAVFALEGASLRGLCMLSLILGSKITDAAVASIVRSCASLELLDLSGSSISDNGVGMICKAFPHTLSRLLLALCPNVTTCGIQFATAQLPLLQLMDCGMTLCASLQNEKQGPYFGEINGAIRFCPKLPTSKKQSTNQKLIIKHGNLKKLSLWGCSAIDALYLNCPELNDLNLNSCTNLNPETDKPKDNITKKSVSIGIYKGVSTSRLKVLNEFAAAEPHLPCKRLADGSKRVQLPQFAQQEPSQDKKGIDLRRNQCTVHLD